MPVRPVVIRDEDQLTALLRGRRIELRIPQQELDDRINWPDGYTAKVEAPHRKYGRRVAWGLSTFLSYWVESLGLALVLMDKSEADALVAASRDAEIAQAAHRPYAGRGRKREIVRRRVFRFGYSFPQKAA